MRYGPKWENAHVDIGGALRRHRDELVRLGWTVEIIPDADHISAMRADTVLPILLPWLKANAMC